MVHFEPPRFILNYIPVSKPVVQSIRGGTSFWVTAGKAGVRSSMLTVPVTFPPEDVPNGELLSGLPLPDIRRTMGTFYYFGTDLSRYEEGNTEFGGILKRLVFDGDNAQTELVGPPNPIVKQQLRELRANSPLSAPSDADKMKIAELEAREDVRLPIAIHWNKADKSATVNIGDNSILLAEHQWSKWINLDFNINLLIRVHGMAQLYLINAGSELQLYISPVNWRPDNPPAAMSSPASLLGRHLRAPRTVPNAGLGGGHLAAQRRSHRREGLHGRPVPRVRRPRAGHPPADRFEAVGSAGRRHRVDRPRAAHDVAAHRSDAPDVRQGAGREVRRFHRARLPEMRRLRRRGHGARRRVDADSHRLGSWLPLVPPVGEPEHLAGAGRVHGDPGPAAWREEAAGPVRRRHVLGKRGLDAHAGVLDGPRPDLRQPPGPRGPRQRRAGRFRQRAECHRRPASRDDRSKDEGADGRRRLQARRHLQGPVPGERVGAAGRLRRRLPRLVANVARRLAAGDRLPEHEEMVGRPRFVRLQADLRHPDLQPAARRPTAPTSWISPRPC